MRGIRRPKGDGLSTPSIGLVVASTVVLSICGTLAYSRLPALSTTLDWENARIEKLDTLITELRTNFTLSAEGVVHLEGNLTVVGQKVDDLQSNFTAVDQRVSDREDDVLTVGQEVLQFESNLMLVDLRVSVAHSLLVDVPAVLTDVWGASWNPIEHHRFFKYNRLTGKATITGSKREALLFQSMVQDFVGQGAGAFIVRVDQSGAANDNQIGSMARFLLQNGNGTSRQQPDFMSDAFNPDGCKAPVILRPHPDARIYVTKTGLEPIDRSDPNEYFSRPFNGTAALYIDTTDLFVAVGIQDVEDAFAAFGVPLNTAGRGVAAVDMSFFIDELFPPIALELAGGSYEGQYHDPC